MSQLDLETLKPALKALIVKECDKDIDPESIGDDVQLIGGALELDSLDALQISLAVKDRYDVRIEGGNEGRTALATVASLAQFIINARATTEATG
jgi:acyl carrier protein